MSHKGKDNPFYGKTHSKDILEKKSKYIYVIEDEDGNMIDKTLVLSLWCKENGLKYNNVKYHVKKGNIYKGYKITKTPRK